MADHVSKDSPFLIRGFVAGWGFRQFVLLVVAGISSMFFARQLHLDGELFVWLALFIVGFLALTRLKLEVFGSHRTVFVAACVFAFLFDLSLVLGSHIVVTAANGGLVGDNYIAPLW